MKMKKIMGRALAAALAHFYESGKPAIAGGGTSWERFLRDHPERIAPRRK